MYIFQTSDDFLIIGRFLSVFFAVSSIPLRAMEEMVRFFWKIDQYLGFFLDDLAAIYSPKRGLFVDFFVEKSCSTQ